MYKGIVFLERIKSLDYETKATAARMTLKIDIKVIIIISSIGGYFICFVYIIVDLRTVDILNLTDVEADILIIFEFT